MQIGLERSDMSKGDRCIHKGSQEKGTILEVDQSYYWILTDSGSKIYVWSGEVSKCK